MIHVHVKNVDSTFLALSIGYYRLRNDVGKKKYGMSRRRKKTKKNFGLRRRPT
jgi:hypothetical protein